MEPILTYSEITGRVYIVTKYRRLDGGIIDAREKFDVTDWVESYAKKCSAQTVEENAKLRELAKNLYECNGSCERCVELMGRCEYKEQLGELGIEVEDV